MPYYYTITIPFEIYNIETGVNEPWSIVFKNENDISDYDFDTRCKMLVDKMSDISMAFDDREYTFNLPEVTFEFIDAIHLPNHVSLLVFISDSATYGGEEKTQALIYQGTTLKYLMVVNKNTIKWDTKNYNLRINLILDTPDLADFRFRDNDGNALNPLSITVYPHDFTYIIDKIFSLVTGRSTVDHMGDIDYVFRTEDSPGNYLTDDISGVTIRQTPVVEETHNDLAEALYGATERIKTLFGFENVKDYLIDVAKAFQLIYGIDEFGESFIRQRIKLYEPVEIPDDEIELIEIEGFQNYKGCYVPSEFQDDPNDSSTFYAIRGKVVLKEDFTAYNSSQVITIDPKIRFRQRELVDMGAGWYDIYDQPIKDIHFRNSDGSYDSYQMIHYFIAKNEWFVNTNSYGYATLHLKGHQRNIWTHYSLNLSFIGSSENLIFLPNKVSRSLLKQNSKISGWLIKG